MRSEYFLAVMKAHGNEGGGRILLGDNTGGGADMVRPIRSRCVGGWISAGLRCVYVYLTYVCSDRTYATYELRLTF